MKIEKELKSSLESFSDEFDEITRESTCLYQLCTGMIWAEGPVFVKTDVIFSDVKGNTMYLYNPDKGLSVYREPANYANGNCLDSSERLITCEHGRRCISRTEHDGTIKVLVDRYEGKRFNSPNDVIVKSDGTIWFSDPPYGIITDKEGYKSESQIIGCYVYKYDPSTGKVSAVITDTQRPNGLAFSPKEDVLYVADMSIVDFPTEGRRHIRAYDMNKGVPSNGRDFAHIEPGIPDGFRVDFAGRLYVSYEKGIKVINNEGVLLGNILIPEKVSNCCFGVDASGQTALFITATSSLYCIFLTI